QGHGVMEMTGDVNDLMATLASGPRELESPTEVGPVLLDTAVTQGAHVGEVTEQAGLFLLGLAKPEMPDIRGTEVGPKLFEVADFQAQALAGANAVVHAQMDELATRGPDAPAVPAEVPGELRNIASSNIVGMLGSVDATREVIHALVNQPGESKNRVSQVSETFRTQTAMHVETMEAATGVMGGQMANLASVKALEAHDPSPVGEAFTGTATFQTDGMIRSARLTGESLTVLVGGPRPPA
ncbi:MAG: hypothetical protein R3F43_25535, partial [bacterium]